MLIYIQVRITESSTYYILGQGAPRGVYSPGGPTYIRTGRSSLLCCDTAITNTTNPNTVEKRDRVTPPYYYKYSIKNYMVRECPNVNTGGGIASLVFLEKAYIYP